MIYLDTYAFVKLYLHEEGTDEGNSFVVAQQEPLQVWYFLERQFLNALRFKVYLAEMSPGEVERIISLYFERKHSGQYFAPHLDPIALHELSVQVTARTLNIGCRAIARLTRRRPNKHHSLPW